MKRNSTKPVANYPYVQSMEAGVFYARCLPKERFGRAGTTQIFRVRQDTDESIDRYDWYSIRGVVLAWSPIVGRVAVATLGGERAQKPSEQVELTFSLGGKLLKAYTLSELEAWGATVDIPREGVYSNIKLLGQEQVPGTNDYVFVAEIKGKRFLFDILTGSLR
jgi:hypothetical protein